LQKGKAAALHDAQHATLDRRYKITPSVNGWQGAVKVIKNSDLDQLIPRYKGSDGHGGSPWWLDFTRLGCDDTFSQALILMAQPWWAHAGGKILLRIDRYWHFHKHACDVQPMD
jgi:hypothetical protein